MKFMLLAMTSKCLGALGEARKSRSASDTCGTAPKYTSPSMRIILSCGHSGSATLRGALASVTFASTTKGRSDTAPPAGVSNPITRIGGREVRCRYTTSDNMVPSKMAISKRMLTVANAVTAAMLKSARLCCHSFFQPGMSNKDHATSSKSAAIAGKAMCDNRGAVKANNNNSRTAENTAAKGVRAPASKLGMDRFTEPQAT